VISARYAPPWSPDLPPESLMHVIAVATRCQHGAETCPSGRSNAILLGQRTVRGLKGRCRLCTKEPLESQIGSLSQNMALLLRKDELQTGDNKNRSQRSAYAVALQPASKP
jgi:hypothetical protein